MSFDSLIFDMDGTLWDTVAEVTASWKETITRSGVPLPAQIDSLSDYFGMTEDEIARRLFPRLSFEESSKNFPSISGCLSSAIAWTATSRPSLKRLIRPNILKIMNSSAARA